MSDPCCGAAAWVPLRGLAAPREFASGFGSALRDELVRRDDFLTTLWTIYNLAQDHPVVVVTPFDPDDPLNRPEAMGRTYVGSLRDAGVDPRLRTALVRQAVATLRELLQLIAEWEREAGTSVLESRWGEFLWPSR